MVCKFTKIFLFILLSFIFKNSFCQDVGNYGTPINKPPAPLTMQFSTDGLKPPKTAFEEYLLKQGKKHSLSFEEKAALDNYEGRKNDIKKHSKNFFVREYKLIRLWFIRIRAKRKQKWLDKKQKELDRLKSDSPYEDPEIKFKLTPEEEDALQKYQQDPNSLTPDEKKAYKRALKKQKQKQKYIKKITFIEFSDQDLAQLQEEGIIKHSAKLKIPKNDSTKTIQDTTKIHKKKKRKKKHRYTSRRIKVYKPVYNPAEDSTNYYYRISFEAYVDSIGKKPLCILPCSQERLRKKMLKRAYKHDKKLNKAYTKHKLERYAKTARWVSYKKKTWKDYLPHISFSRKNRPSKIERKLRKYAKKYKLTPREQAAYIMARSGYSNLNIWDRLRAKRAARKIYLYNTKTQKTLKKAFLEIQHPEVQKRLKKQNKQIKKRDKKRYRKLRWHQFKKSIKQIFKRPKR